MQLLDWITQPGRSENEMRNLQVYCNIKRNKIMQCDFEYRYLWLKSVMKIDPNCRKAISVIRLAYFDEVLAKRHLQMSGNIYITIWIFKIYIYIYIYIYAHARISFRLPTPRRTYTYIDPVIY